MFQPGEKVFAVHRGKPFRATIAVNCKYFTSISICVLKFLAFVGHIFLVEITEIILRT